MVELVLSDQLDEFLLLRQVGVREILLSHPDALSVIVTASLESLLALDVVFETLQLQVVLAESVKQYLAPIHYHFLHMILLQIVDVRSK